MRRYFFNHYILMLALLLTIGPASLLSAPIFPHLADDGTVNWYAPADELTASLDTEHQKYIREVLPRLQQEIMAGHWETVDACIDRMIQYQCQFGSSDSRPQPQSTAIILIFLAFAALFIGSLLVVQRKKYWKLHISQ